MRRNKFFYLFLMIVMTVFFGCINNELAEKIVWFDKPAKYFEEAFPLGNGFIGMMVKGGAPVEDLVLNEGSLWAGEPVDPNMNPEAWKNLEPVRKALFSEDYRLAEDLVKKMQGKFSESFAPLGNLKMSFIQLDSITEYKRKLDLSTGIANVDYSAGNNKFHRELFVSNPDRVVVIMMKGDSPASLNFTLFSTSLLKFNTRIQNNDYIMDGVAPIHAEPSYNKDVPNPIVYDTTGKGMRFRMIARIVKTDGKIFSDNIGLHVENASEAMIILSVGTSFNGYDNDPGLNGKDEKKIALDFLEKASLLSYDELKTKHVNDFSALFNRVSLSLNNAKAPDLPINQRLMNYKDSVPDPELEALYFQFGRYLLISSSRPGGIPTNLQGIWNPHMRPPWSSNFTTNINSEMNYWPAEVTNLSETHLPLLQHIGNISKTGEVTARTFYNCRGWCCSHNTDIWAMTNPVGNFGKGDPNWANWSMAGAWYSLHLYEHFAFTCDTTWMKEYAWPIMKGATRFCLDFLVSDPKGYLVTAPSTSPENRFKTPDGFAGSTLYGGTADIAFIKGLFNKVLIISNLLKTDPDLAVEVQTALDKMYPYQVGKKGNLQEWYHDWEDSDPRHRHISHLISLYPDNQISPLTTPQLAAAAKRSLELRGDGGAGWSKAWKINTWARLLDGNHAYKMLRSHLKYVSPSFDDDNSYSDNRGGTYPNLFDACPPFQIDGNFGGTAGIAEMLLQSHLGEIHLLPALPGAWEEGYIKGLRARGGFTVDQFWENGELTRAIIMADKSGLVRIRYSDKTISKEVKGGEKLIVTPLMFK